jgi:hypothetical protein
LTILQRQDLDVAKQNWRNRKIELMNHQPESSFCNKRKYIDTNPLSRVLWQSLRTATHSALMTWVSLKDSSWFAVKVETERNDPSVRWQ